MQTKKDIKSTNKEILQATVTLPSEETLQEEAPIVEILQRNILVDVAPYNKAMQRLKDDGVDKNTFFQRIIDLVNEVDGFTYAVLTKKVSITTNSQNYVKEKRENSTGENR